MYSFESPYFAAIDLGSNSFHMLVVRFTEARIEIIDREKEMVQIARGLKKTGNLDEEAQARALSCLHKFSERLRDIPAAQIRAVGTKTLRAARNSKSFLKAAEAALGVPIQIISGYEEARLVYTGLAHTVVNEYDTRLVIDIGGGSTEFVIGKSYDTYCMESLSLGCVTYTENFALDPDNISASGMQRAYITACSKLEQIRKRYLEQGWKMAYGTSGTMRAVAQLLNNNDSSAVIHRTVLEEFIRQLVKSKKLEAPNSAKLRRNVLPAGLAILRAIFEQLKIDKIHVADATLKEGLIYDNIGRFSNHDARASSVKTLQEKYRIDSLQAKTVSKTAVHLWQQLESTTLISGVSRTKILNWAGRLHEIGLSISHNNHNLHGYYILRHSDLAGFSRHEQYIMANLVKYHRKKITPPRLADIDTDLQQAFVPLLICLRLSVLLHRRRELSDLLPELKQKKQCYILSLDDIWLEEHPLTHASLELEACYLEKFGLEFKFN